MKTHFVTYSDRNFESQRINLCNYAKKTFDYVHEYTRDWIEETEFYKKNFKLLDLDRGAGLWIWKPYIILETLKKIEYGDIIFYLDCADIFTEGLSNFLKNYYSQTKCDSLLTFGGQNKQKWYTKKDAFVLMNCDEPKYTDHVQLEAGIISLRKTDEIQKVINEWLEFCLVEDIIMDSPNLHGENYEGFIKHQSDQSILTNLAIRYNLNINDVTRNFVTCNVNQ